MKRFFSFFFCFIVIFVSVSPVFGVAWVGDILIDNTQIVVDATENTLNHLLGYNGAVTTALNDVIKIVLYGSDMYPALEEAAKNSGFDGDVTAYLLYQLTYYTSGQNIQDVNKQMLVDGLHVLNDGRIVIGEQLGSWIYDFMNWLWVDQGLVNSSPFVPGGYESNGVPLAKLGVGESLDICTLYTSNSTIVAKLINNGSNDLYFCGADNYPGFIFPVYTGFSVGGNGYVIQVIGSSSGNLTFTSSSFGTASLVLSGLVSYSWLIPHVDFSVIQSSGSPNVTTSLIRQGDPDWLIPDSIYQIDLPDVYTPTVNVPGGLGGVVLPVDYIHGVSDSLDGDPVDVPVYDPDTGSPVGTVTLDPTGDELPGEVITAVPEDAVSNPFENIAEGDGLGDFHLDINFRDLFPFCIPFDIYDLLSSFTAEAEAPNFEFPIKSEIGGIDETINFDLSQFDSAAATLRKLELVAFAIGLAFLTKQLLS